MIGRLLARLSRAFSGLPVLRERADRLELKTRLARRFGAPLFGLLVLGLSAPRLPGALAWTLLVPLALAALGRDLWTFDLRLRRLTRRVGLGFVRRTWSLDFVRIRTLYLAREGDLEGASAGTGDDTLYAPLLGSRRPGWTSLGLELDDGRALPLLAVPPAEAEALAALALSVSRACALALESRPGAPPTCDA